MTWVPRVAAIVVVVLAAVSGACVPQPGTGPLPGLSQYAGREVRRIEFDGAIVVPRDSLGGVIATESTQCRIPLFPASFCPIPFGLDRAYLELDELARDLLRIQLYHRDHGYYGTRVVPSIDPLGGDNVAVFFTIDPGERVILRDLAIEGVEAIVDTAELRADLPLEVGEPFRRAGFLEAADSIRSALLQRGHVYADVLRNYSLDITTGLAEAQYIAIPGPVVAVDSVVVVGAQRLGGETVREQITLDAGDTLRVSELNRSQRNLYALDMVRFASVDIAADTLQLNPDTARATILARIVEAPQYLVDAAVGYGTIDCLRTAAGWTNRNFLGGGRVLDLNAQVSKVGVGAPLNWGLEDSFLCRNLQEDQFSDTLNYRVAAEFQEPRLLGTANRLAVGLHAERLSEVNTFMRRSVGGRVALTRGIRGALVSTTLEVERGSTQALPLVFCISFDQCDPEDVDMLQRSRWSNSLSLGVGLDRTFAPGEFVTDGYSLRGNVAWASTVLGSEDEYLRALGEGAAYHELSPGWVLAGRVLAGKFLSGSLAANEGFIPPERRFYAGGPNSVRGYARNALGPRAYVVEEITEEGDTVTNTSATGGTEIVLATLELRAPSPLLAQWLRLAAFVDAGQLWAPDTRAVTEGIRVTPGLGVRITTPVGPIRFDVGYNGYGREAGPLYAPVEGGQIRLIDPRFTPEIDGFWDRIQIHFAVGQAF